MWQLHDAYVCIHRARPRDTQPRSTDMAAHGKLAISPPCKGGSPKHRGRLVLVRGPPANPSANTKKTPLRRALVSVFSKRFWPSCRLVETTLRVLLPRVLYGRVAAGWGPRFLVPHTRRGVELRSGDAEAAPFAKQNRPIELQIVLLYGATFVQMGRLLRLPCRTCP